MAKQKPTSALHHPLSAILGTQGKLAALRVLASAAAPLAHREVVRRSGMAYRSIDLALADLLASGLVEEMPGGRERRVRLRAGHRLAPVITALLRSEADFFPSIRTELRAIAAGGEREGLLAVAIVGAVARLQEVLGAQMELVVISVDAPAAMKWGERFSGAAESLAERFGVRCHIISYDLDEARKLWRNRTDRAERLVREAEGLVGEKLLTLMEVVD